MTAAYDRKAVAMGDEGALSGFQCFFQIAVGLSLYVYGAVSTPGWLSILLAVPLTSLLFLLASAAPDRPSKLYLLPCLVSFLDAQLAFFALCAVIGDVLPDISAYWAALAAALPLAFSIIGIRPHALPRLARLLIWVLLPMGLFCLLCVPGHGKISHFFPLLGSGPLSILRGSLWMAGAAAGAFCPLMLPARLPEKRPLIRPLLFSLLLGTALALVSAYLMPFYALALPHTLGWRMLLVTHMTPSVPCWSMQVTAVLMGLTLSAAAGIDRAQRLLCRALNHQKAPWPVTALLILLLIPAAAIGGRETEHILIVLGPARYFLMAAAFIALRINKRREKPCGG